MRSFKTTTGILFATAILLTACGSADKKGGDKDTATANTPTEPSNDKGSPSKLDGSWIIKRAEGMLDSANIGTVYAFDGNKLSFGKGGFTNPGKTEITDSTFSFQADGNEYKFMYDYKFNGDTLVVEMQKSGGQVFYMVRN